MKLLLRTEALGELILGLYLYAMLDLNWWWFAALFLAPDLGMLGYLAGPKVGAWTYNTTHHKGIAIACYLLGILGNMSFLAAAGTLLFAHAAFDRTLGYGLKRTTGFKDTHLGKLP